MSINRVAGERIILPEMSAPKCVNGIWQYILLWDAKGRWSHYRFDHVWPFFHSQRQNSSYVLERVPLRVPLPQQPYQTPTNHFSTWKPCKTLSRTRPWTLLKANPSCQWSSHGMRSRRWESLLESIPRFQDPMWIEGLPATVTAAMVVPLAATNGIDHLPVRSNLSAYPLMDLLSCIQKLQE